MRGEGLRFNEGKLRYDLVNPWAHEQMVSVLTKGSLKYAERNWESGMKWGNIISSLERHIAAIKKGEDYDAETGELHAAHAACNIHFLTAYYKIFPEGDDRPHSYLNPKRIGLDIDEVLVDWLGAYKEKYDYDCNHEFPSWTLNYEILRHCKEDLDEEFYKNLKPKIDPKTIPFEPHCYITARNIDQKVTEEWLHSNGFPCSPVYSVKIGTSKVELAKESGVELFVDDVYSNFVELNNAGICTFLFDAPHNRRYDVGHKRIYSLKELYG